LSGKGVPGRRIHSQNPPSGDVVGRLRAIGLSDQTAAMAVVVDAKDEAAAAFYRHYGFGTLQAQPSRLFVPMRLVAQLLG